MPLVRYQIKNEYSLADPELHKAAEKDDPEALLETVAMAGLVGVLRQLGDLAEFAAKIFHDLHEDVMATATRGHGLMARVQQLETEFSSIEKAFLSQTNHLSFFSNAGIDWHPNLQCEQNLVTRGDLPRFVMNSYEECRGPPRLFLLDKFDVAGAGACLKRYTDPSFIKMEAASSGDARAEVHRETRIYKVKQKKGTGWRNGETPEVGARTKLHQLLLEERLENVYTNPARLVKLKKRELNGFAVEAKSGRSYMEKLLETPSPDHKMVCETSMIPLHLKLTSDDDTPAAVRILEISTCSPVKRTNGHESTFSSLNEQELGFKSLSDMDREADGDLVKVHGERPPGVTDVMSATHLEAHETELAMDGQKKIEPSRDGYHSDDVISEVDNYLDALTAMDSEMETYNKYRLNYSFLNAQRAADADGREEHQLQAQFSDSQSFGDSFMSDRKRSSKRDKNEEHADMHAHFSDSESIGTYSTSDENSSFKRDRNEGIMELQAQLSDSQPIGIFTVSEETSSLKIERNQECMELQAHFSDSQSIENSTSDEISSIRKERTYSSHNDSLGPVVEDIESDGCNGEGLLSSSKYSLLKTDGGKFSMQGNAYMNEDEIPDSGQASSNSHPVNSGHMSFGSDVETLLSVARSTGTQFQEKPSDSTEHYSKLSEDRDMNYVVKPIASVPDALSQMKEDACPVVSSEKVPVSVVGDAAFSVDSNALLQASNVSEFTPEDQRHVGSKIYVFPDEARNGSLVECSSYWSMPVDLSLGPMLPPDGLDSKSEDQLSIKDLSPVVETPMAGDFEGEQCADLGLGSPQDEPGSERVVLYHDQQANVQAISRMLHYDERNASTYTVGAVENNCYLEHPDYGRQNNHIMLCDVVTEEVDSEDKVVSVVPSAVNIENGANVSTASGLKSSTNLANLQEGSLGSSDSYLKQMEANEIESTEIFTNVDAGQRDIQLEQSSDSTSSNNISSPMWDLGDAQQFLSNSVDIHVKEKRINEAVARESLSELEAQKEVDQGEVASTNIISAPMKNITNSEESLSSFMEAEADERIAKESLKEQDEPKFVDQLEVISAGAKSSLRTFVSREPAKSETFISVEDSSLGEEILHHSVSDTTIRPEFSDLDTQASESKSLAQNGLLQDGKDKMSLASFNHLGSEISSEQFFQSQDGQKDVEFVLTNEEKYKSENHQSTQTQISNELEKERSSNATSESAPDQPSSRKLLSESACETIKPIEQDINPSNPLLPAYYPKPAAINLEDMPPMPPLPPMQWRTNKVQNTSLASHRESEVSHTSFLPIQPIKTEETTKFSLSGSERQTWQYQNPYLPVMAVEGDRLQHTSGFSMGFPGHSVAIPLQFPVVFNEPNSSYNYLYLDRSSQYFQSPIVSLPLISTGRPPHGDHITSEGEVAQYSSPGTPVPSVENAFEHESVHEKVIQPSSQMAADTNSEAEVLEQSSSDLHGEQEGPLISSVSPPNMETTPPNINTLPSEDEMALSLDASNQTSGFEVEMPNGKPHNKLPRPRSPLIDAVAAHDKSKLRKVIERVRPQIAPKEDEKDTFLEQIRAKSFNLKPAAGKRPNIQGPKTNLKVAAILEKANAIRQALAGSDEDDDADSWSDS